MKLSAVAVFCGGGEWCPPHDSIRRTTAASQRRSFALENWDAGTQRDRTPLKNCAVNQLPLCTSHPPVWEEPIYGSTEPVNLQLSCSPAARPLTRAWSHVLRMNWQSGARVDGGGLSLAAFKTRGTLAATRHRHSGDSLRFCRSGKSVSAMIALGPRGLSDSHQGSARLTIMWYEGSNYPQLHSLQPLRVGVNSCWSESECTTVTHERNRFCRKNQTTQYCTLCCGWLKQSAPLRQSPKPAQVSRSYRGLPGWFQ